MGINMLRDSESSTGTRSTVEPLILDDYDERSWFGDSGVPDPGRDPIAQAINLLARPDTMGNLEALISESYKFIRMADDLHDVARYLNDMRLCFIALTVTGYLLMIIYGIIFCVRRNRRRPNAAQAGGLNNNGQVRRGRWDYQMENRDYQTHAQTDDLVSVRSDGQGNTASYMGRNHHRNPPSFMRHGMNHAQQTARLMADQDGGVVKHQIPHITTDPPSSGESENSPSSKVPELLKGNERKQRRLKRQLSQFAAEFDHPSNHQANSCPSQQRILHRSPG